MLSEFWEQRKRPILGSQLKAVLSDRASQLGEDFDEHALGYRSFSDFLADSGIAAIRIRPGTDLLAAPIGHENALEEEPERRPRLRKEIWDAFVRFPVPGESRYYVPGEDTVRVQPNSMPPPADSTLIEPIPAETQLEWRRAFIHGLPEGEQSRLRETLESERPFAEFSKSLGGPTRKAWITYFVSSVFDLVRTWAKQSGIDESVYLERRRDGLRDVRAAIYSVLDSVPTERLLELRIPIRWFLDRE